jgi:hypothetical protein
MAEAVEKVRKLKIIETMIHYSGLHQSNIAENAKYQNYSCVNIGGPDFFNSLG